MLLNRLSACHQTILLSCGHRVGIVKDCILKILCDKFLAFWNAIEVVASKYYQDVSGMDVKCAKKGCKNQIYGCFKALWRDREQWPVIAKHDDGIYEYYKSRLSVAHGIILIDIEKVRSIASKLDVLETVATRFLQDWHETFLVINDPKLRCEDSATVIDDEHAEQSAASSP